MNKSVKKSLLIIALLALVIVVALKFLPRFEGTSKVIIDDKSQLSDLPYIFINKHEATLKWINNGQEQSQTISTNSKVDLNSEFTFRIDDLLKICTEQMHEHHNIENIVVLSDIHGQYDLFKQLLRVNKVIDSNGNWQYQNGHLVVIGDAFDRGDKVNETLWHLLKLMQQAQNEGGNVHYLLGNHDIMVLNGDLRYINDKYKQIEELTEHTYQELYGDNTLMGKWLRSCPVVLRINDVLFSHGGLSLTMVNHGFSIDKINQLFATDIIDNHKDSIRADEKLSLLARSQGPIWYRGYFTDTTLTNASIDSILHHFNAKQIIVGHTSMERVEVLFDKRILAADTSIKKGENGELLFIENKHYYRAGLDGVKMPLW